MLKNVCHPQKKTLLLQHINNKLLKLQHITRNKHNTPSGPRVLFENEYTQVWQYRGTH